MTIRTRFAPSPTGHLHLGGLRTAFYSWLYARKHNGKFILRIEDTDRERLVPEATAVILDVLDWLGLNYDEGPYYQTKRLDRYQEVMDLLLKEGKAYRCFCDKERLEALRSKQVANKETPRYDGFCRDHQGGKPSQDRPCVIRFRNPVDGEVIIDDRVYGRVIFKNEELDDFIIVRTDGMPTYNFSVVVDDLDTNITHVFRANEHLSNTPKQINLLKALGAQLPVYVHLPALLGSDGKKLSKRHGALSVMHYEQEGYLPDALLNYLVRLGWSHGDQEIFSRAEMIQYFNIENISKSPAAMNPEKLLWLNQHYLKTTQPDLIAELLAGAMRTLNIKTKPEPALVDIVTLQRERTKTLKDMAEKSRYFYETVSVDASSIPADKRLLLKQLRDVLHLLTAWTDETIHQALQDVAAQAGVKLGELAQPLRLVVTGGTVSPPINSTLRLLGKANVIQRLDQVVK